MADSNVPYKSNRGAPRSLIPKDDVHVSVETEVILYFRLKYLDTFTQTTRKGALSELVNRLLKEEMKRDMEATRAKS